VIALMAFGQAATLGAATGDLLVRGGIGRR
jgi:hypothetical protein